MNIRRLSVHATKNAAPVVKQESGTTTAQHDSDTINQSSVDAIDMTHYNKDRLKFEDIADIKVGLTLTVSSRAIENVQTLKEYLSDIKEGRYKDVVEKYRTFIGEKTPIEVKSAAARSHKASVPCCVPHSACMKAPINNELQQNGLMQVDIDVLEIGNVYVTEKEICDALEACPYVFAYHKSIGGKGYVGYAYTEDSIEKAFWVVAKYFQEQRLYIDLSKGSGTGDRRFVSYDPDLVIKEDFKPVKAIARLDKATIVKSYLWLQPDHKQLVKRAEEAFTNWVKKNGGFDWTSSGPAAPAGLLARVVEQHRHNLSQDELMQLGDWCVYLYNEELIVDNNRHTWKEYLDRYGKVAQSNSTCITQSNTDEAAEIMEQNGIFVTSVTFFDRVPPRYWKS